MQKSLAKHSSQGGGSNLLFRWVTPQDFFGGLFIVICNYAIAYAIKLAYSALAPCSEATYSAEDSSKARSSKNASGDGCVR